MTTSQSPLIIGAFQTENEAGNALEALQNAGFAREQLGFAGRESGAVTNTLLNDFMNLGVPQEQASYYDNEFKAGHPIVSVRADGREQEAMNILQSNGGYTYERQSSGYAQAGTYSQTTASDAAEQYGTDEERRLKLREEKLQAEKERVQTGEAHIRKDVVEEQQRFDVPVTHEEVMVERRPGSGQPSDAPIGQDETISVPTSEERVRVTKQPVETGEVVVRKQGVQEQQPVSDTVRREEAHLEREGEPKIRSNENLEQQ